MTTQAMRRARTRQALIEAARAAFAAKGFDAASTPEIAAAAGVSRGALYHHFKDKKALFCAVVEAMQAEALAAISAAGAAGDPVEALKAGAKAWIETASAPDFSRIVMTDGPAVLGLEGWRALDRARCAGSLEQGLRHARGKGRIAFRSARAMAAMLSGALNEASRTGAGDEERADLFRDFCTLIDGLKL